MSKALKLSEYKTVAQLEAENPDVFKRARVLDWVRRAADNGLAPFVLKHGKTVAIHEPSLRVWMRSPLRVSRQVQQKPDAALRQSNSASFHSPDGLGASEGTSKPKKQPVKVSRARCWQI